MADKHMETITYTVTIPPPPAKRFIRGELEIKCFGGFAGVTYSRDTRDVIPGETVTFDVPTKFTPIAESTELDGLYLTVTLEWQNVTGSRKERVQLRPIRANGK